MAVVWGIRITPSSKRALNFRIIISGKPDASTARYMWLVCELFLGYGYQFHIKPRFSESVKQKKEILSPEIEVSHDTTQGLPQARYRNHIKSSLNVEMCLSNRRANGGCGIGGDIVAGYVRVWIGFFVTLDFAGPTSLSKPINKFDRVGTSIIRDPEPYFSQPIGEIRAFFAEFFENGANH